MTWLLNQLVTPALSRLQTALYGIVTSNSQDDDIPETQRGDEIGGLANAILEVQAQIARYTQDMNRRLDARDRDIQAVQQISGTAVAQLDSQSLLNNIVERIVSLFPEIYHAQIFLLDARQEFAVLRASTGEAGRELLQRGHRLEVGGTSVIGQVTEQGRLVIARNTVTSDVHRQNVFLPETRAELAVPLRWGNQIIGALDVQSRQSDSFDEDMVSVLQSMADQLSIAIENTRLYEESTRRLQEIEFSQQRRTRYAWEDYIYSQRQTMLASQAGYQTPNNFSALRDAVFEQKQTVIGDVTERQTIPVAVPIWLKSELLGVIEWEIPEQEFDRNRILLAEDLASRLATSLDNARLVQETQRSANRERILNQISSQITGQTNIDSILQTAVREVGQALQVPRVNIRLGRKVVAQTETIPDETAT